MNLLARTLKLTFHTLELKWILSYKPNSLTHISYTFPFNRISFVRYTCLMNILNVGLNYYFYTNLIKEAYQKNSKSFPLLQAVLKIQQSLLSPIRPIYLAVFIIFFLFSPTILSAQANRTAQEYTDQAQAYTTSNHFDSALVYLLKAASIYQPLLDTSMDSTLWSKYLMVSNQIAFTYYHLGQYDTGVDHLKSLVEEVEGTVVKRYPEYARTFNILGLLDIKRGKFKASSNYFHKALTLLDSLKTDNDIYRARIYNNLFILYYAQGVYGTALAHLKQSYDVAVKIFGNSHQRIGLFHSNFGMIYGKLGRNEIALSHFEKALNILYETLGDDHLEVGRVYNSIASDYLELSEYDKALDYFQQSLQIHIKHLGKAHTEVGNIYVGVADTQIALEMPEQALNLYQKALDIYISGFGEQHVRVTQTYNRIGNIYRRLKNFDDAIRYQKKAESILTQLYGDEYYELADIYAHLADTYYDQLQYDSALYFYQEAHRMKAEIYSEKHPKLANSFLDLGNVWASKDNFDQALKNYQEALCANSNTFNQENIYELPSLEDQYLSGSIFLKTLIQKANIHYQLYEANPTHWEDLFIAHQTYLIASQSIEKIKNEFHSKVDKRELVQTYFHAFEGAVKSSFELRGHKLKNEGLKQAFIQSEKSKSMLMREFISGKQAQQFANIPDSLISYANDLSSSITSYEKMLYDQQGKNHEWKSEKIPQLQSTLFQLKAQQDSLNRHIEYFFPAYHGLKYDIPTAELRDIQSNLKPTETILEYFWGDDRLFVFVIKCDTFVGEELIHIESLESDINQFRKGIFSYYLSKGLNQDKITAKYLESAYTLYKILIQPIEDLLSEDLIIVPDAELGYLPFSALLTQKTELSQIVSKRPYLIKDYSISYAYSASLLREMEAMEVYPTEELLAIAPSFRENPRMYVQNNEARRDYLGPLRYNVPEVEAIAEKLSGKLLLDTAATIDQFIALAPNFRILHLSTHGKVNINNANYSFLAFYDPEDSVLVDSEVQYGISSLFLADLYNLSLNAELVVLSACETGLGDLFKGEGIASLAQGFSYAGAKSIITTLWSVNDKASAELMTSFYDHLANNRSKHDALRLAQLEAIKQGKEPFFWAGFIPIGDMRAISLNSFPFKPQLIALFICVLFICFFLFTQKNINRSRNT